MTHHEKIKAIFAGTAFSLTGYTSSTNPQPQDFALLQKGGSYEWSQLLQASLTQLEQDQTLLDLPGPWTELDRLLARQELREELQEKLAALAKDGWPDVPRGLLKHASGILSDEGKFDDAPALVGIVSQQRLPLAEKNYRKCTTWLREHLHMSRYWIYRLNLYPGKFQEIRLQPGCSIVVSQIFFAKPNP